MSIEANNFLSLYSNTEPDPNHIESITKMMDPRYLPTFEEATNPFNFSHIERRTPSDWNYFTIEYLDYSVYEFFTQEYINGLSDYLSKRILDIFNKSNKKVTILDIGSGNGRLPYFLNEKLSNQISSEIFQIVAIDHKKSGWDFKHEDNIFEVLDMECEEGLEKFDPQIVIASWMPGEFAPTPRKSDDWPSKFREKDRIEEYILIGRDYWEEYYLQDSYMIPSNFVPSYIYEGFRRFDHLNLSKYQICFEDGPSVKDHKSVSKTVSFIRNISN